MPVMASQGMTRNQLQDKCARALQSYIELLQEGCELLGKVKEIPMPEHERTEIFTHRRKEISAQSEYTKARTELWGLLIDSKNQSKE